MIQRIASRLRAEDKGFTLIELMVVVLIIGILIAIAIPTFLGARTRAQDRAAQASARNALTAAKAIFTDNEDYTAATDVALAPSEPSLTFVAAATALVAADEPTKVSVSATGANEWHAAVRSKSGTCWFIRDMTVSTGSNPGTRWAKVTDGAPACSGGDAAGVPDANYTGQTPANAAAQ